MPSVKRSVKRSGHHGAQGGFLHEPLAVVLMPVLLNQNFSPDFNINYRLGAYAPTGSYEVGRLANTGKNFWTIEPTVGFMYAGQQNGRAASVFLGADYNFENEDTHYQSGTQMHIDGTLAQHFPLWGGLAFFIARSLADAQEILPFPPTPSASTTGLSMNDSIHKKRVAPKRLAPGAPNILIVLIDDVGPATPSTYGGEIQTPTLDRVAKLGISYNRIHSCHPLGRLAVRSVAMGLRILGTVGRALGITRSRAVVGTQPWVWVAKEM